MITAQAAYLLQCPVCGERLFGRLLDEDREAAAELHEAELEYAGVDPDGQP